MYLVVGLGNYGDNYTYTRHNVGFLFADVFANSLGADFRLQPNLQSELAEARDSFEKYITIKPHTYMNLSGEAVAKVMAKFNIEPEHVIVISDDTNLDFGVVRTRFGGEAGGHNGLKSIMQHIGSNFWRIRIGVGKPPEQFPLERWVLSKLTDEEIRELNSVYKKIVKKYFEAGAALQEETMR